jgi:hypothetical protein
MTRTIDGSFALVLHPYSGCGPIELIGRDTLDACRRRAARRIRMHRNPDSYGYPVSVLERGREWELESDPDGGHRIGDGEGILRIEELTRECRECSCEVNRAYLDGPTCKSCSDPGRDEDND